MKTNKMTELSGSVIAIVCNSFAGCETLSSIEDARAAANARIVKGLTAMDNSGVFEQHEVEDLSNFARGYVELVSEKTRERVVTTLREQFEF